MWPGEMSNINELIKKSIKFTTNIKQLLECLNSPLIQTEF